MTTNTPNGQQPEPLLPGIDGDLSNGDPLPNGMRVRIVGSKYSGVRVGTVGRVELRHVGGYGVSINARWGNPLTNDRTSTVETRVMWFERHELQPLLELIRV